MANIYFMVSLVGTGIIFSSAKAISGSIQNNRPIIGEYEIMVSAIYEIGSRMSNDKYRSMDLRKLL